jgi:hypothetical protein
MGSYWERVTTFVCDVVETLKTLQFCLLVYFLNFLDLEKAMIGRRKDWGRFASMINKKISRIIYLMLG